MKGLRTSIVYYNKVDANASGNDGSSYRCTDTRSVLEGMESLGEKGLPVGCRGGGCGVCKVQILSGSYTKRGMSRAHVSLDEEASGCVLACRIKPTSDLLLRVLGKMKKRVCGVVEAADVLSPST